MSWASPRSCDPSGCETRFRSRPSWRSGRSCSSSPTTARSCRRSLLALPYGALNLHPSLLPRHRGATPIPAAILAGDAETGVTLMRMDEGLDTGPIVAQESVSLEGTETAPLLEGQLEIMAGASSRAASVHGSAVRSSRARSPRRGATLTRPLRREDGRLDPGLRAVELWRQVRAYQPWPGSFVDTPEGRLVVLEASAGTVGCAGWASFGSRGPHRGRPRAACSMKSGPRAARRCRGMRSCAVPRDRRQRIVRAGLR